MAEGGHNAYRFSISWPRIIKNKEGEVNKKGIEFYRSLIDECRKYDIEPFVTCYHWDLPEYWQECGGWLNKDVVYALRSIVKYYLKNLVM